MIWYWMRILWAMLILSCLAACGGSEAPPEPTLTLVPSSTPPPEPTGTPEPTHTPLPTSTPTQTPSPTATLPPPDASLEGILFLDANGSGLQDQTSFICPDLDATPPSLAYFFPDAVGCTPGQLVEVMEPDLAGLTVNLNVDNQTITTLTDSNGAYQVTIPGGSNGEEVMLSIQDPNEGNPELELRYINIWQYEAMIPAYVIEETKVPVQVLNATKTATLRNTIEVTIGANNQMGLMQGIGVLPMEASVYNDVFWISGYDHDPRKIHSINWKGDATTLCVVHLSCETNYAGDSHVGWDYGLPTGSIARANTSGYVTTWVNTDTNGSINLEIVTDFPVIDKSELGKSSDIVFDNATNLRSVYSHFSQLLIATGDFVQIGQILGLSGDTGTQWEHLHFDINYGDVNPAEEDDWQVMANFKDPYGVLSTVDVYFPYERNGMWTVYNLPQFPLVSSGMPLESRKTEN